MGVIRRKGCRSGKIYGRGNCSLWRRKMERKERLVKRDISGNKQLVGTNVQYLITFLT